MLSTPRSLDNPIRAELFGVERLEQHAESLAAAQPVITRLSRGRRLLARVEDNGRVLRESYRVIANAIREERAIVPAAEWLVDNFHVVDEQLREIRDDLPRWVLPGAAQARRGAARRVPARLRNRLGLRGAHRQPLRPRDAPSLRARLPARAAADDRRAVGGGDHAARRARGEPPAPGREHRSRARDATGSRRAGRRAARRRRRRGRGAGRAGPRALRERPAGRPPSRCSSSSGCASRTARSRPALLWLDQRLGAQGTTSDDIVRVEHQRQAAMNVTVRNVILSMSLMSALDWTEFFETVSLVDEVLRAGPTTRAMDFATRDAYRHAIEELARGSGRSELDVAQRGHGASARRGRQRGRPAARSRLLPHRQRARRPRGGARLPGTAAAPAASPVCRPGDARRIWERSPCSARALIALPLLAAWASGVGSRAPRWSWHSWPSSQPRTWRSPC